MIRTLKVFFIFNFCEFPPSYYWAILVWNVNAETAIQDTVYSRFSSQFHPALLIICTNQRATTGDFSSLTIGWSNVDIPAIFLHHSYNLVCSLYTYIPSRINRKFAKNLRKSMSIGEVFAITASYRVFKKTPGVTSELLKNISSPLLAKIYCIQLGQKVVWKCRLTVVLFKRRENYRAQLTVPRAGGSAVNEGTET